MGRVDLPRLAVCGPSQCGKDAAAMFLARHFGFRFVGSSSKYLLDIMASDKRDGRDREQLAALRDTPEGRRELYEYGCALRRESPGSLVMLAAAENDLLVGFRDRSEIEFMQRYGVVDLTLWVDRPVAPDATLEYGSEVADVIVPNRHSLPELHARLHLLGRLLCGVGR